MRFFSSIERVGTEKNEDENYQIELSDLSKWSRHKSFFCQKFNEGSVHKLRCIFEERSFQKKYGDL